MKGKLVIVLFIIGIVGQTYAILENYQATTIRKKNDESCMLQLGHPFTYSKSGGIEVTIKKFSAQDTEKKESKDLTEQEDLQQFYIALLPGLNYDSGQLFERSQKATCLGSSKDKYQICAQTENYPKLYDFSKYDPASKEAVVQKNFKFPDDKGIVFKPDLVSLDECSKKNYCTMIPVLISCRMNTTKVVDIGVKQFNMNKNKRNYLSLGENQLPALHTVFSFLYVIAVVLWTMVTRREHSDRRAIHTLCRAAIWTRLLSAIFSACLYINVAMTAKVVFWNFAFIVSYNIHSILLFVIVMLLAAEWSSPGDPLSKSMKRVIVVFLFMMGVQFIGMFPLEFAPNDSPYVDGWKVYVFIVRVATQITMLVSHVLTSRHYSIKLSEGGINAGMNRSKLRQYRYMYLIIFFFIIMEKVAVLVRMYAIAPHHYYGNLIYELSEYMFYVVVGFLFRPAAMNNFVPLTAGAEMANLGSI